MSRDDRHAAAVASSLAWADEAAARGDFGEALEWLQAVEAAGDVLPDAYAARREDWSQRARS
jgi:hypothetical protein